MNLNDKIRTLREIKNWSQEEMANRLAMSKSGYAKLERGESKLHINRLEQIAKIFNIDVMELINTNHVGSVLSLFSGDNSSQSIYYGSEMLQAEIEKQNLIIEHQKEMLKQKEREIDILNKLLHALEEKNSK